MTPTFPTSSSICDVLVVGGGIVGLATALRIFQSRPQLRNEAVTSAVNYITAEDALNWLNHCGLFT